MEAKEKAKELVSKFKFYQLPKDKRILIDNSKQCALICIDEILESFNYLEYYPEEFRDYWQDVKQEINKL